MSTVGGVNLSHCPSAADRAGAGKNCSSDRLSTVRTGVSLHEVLCYGDFRAEAG